MDFVYLITNPPPEQVLLPDIERRDVDLPLLPDAFHIRRGFGVAAQRYGPYSAQEVADYLVDGSLSPEDYYLASNGQWEKLQNSGLGHA
jgi:hypothetical protein